MGYRFAKSSWMQLSAASPLWVNHLQKITIFEYGRSSSILYNEMYRIQASRFSLPNWRVITEQSIEPDRLVLLYFVSACHIVKARGNVNKIIRLGKYPTARVRDTDTFDIEMLAGRRPGVKPEQ